MTALAMASSNYVRTMKANVQLKKMLVVSLKELVAKD
jgi:hypothetical protein